MRLEGAVEGLQDEGGGEPVEGLEGGERMLVGVIVMMGRLDVMGKVSGEDASLLKTADLSVSMDTCHDVK